MGILDKYNLTKYEHGCFQVRGGGMLLLRTVINGIRKLERFVALLKDVSVENADLGRRNTFIHL